MLIMENAILAAFMTPLLSIVMVIANYFTRPLQEFSDLSSTSQN